jgi:hypothetical protein
MPRDATGQVLQALQQVSFAVHMRGFADKSFGFGDGIHQWLGIHRIPLMFQYWTESVGISKEIYKLF